MGLATFIGGIHPYEGKELSEDKPIKVLEPLQGEIMVYPLSQHIGAPAKPLVAKGDHVLKGQIIAEAGGFISANVLSSVSGTVKGIESKLVANGAMVQSILVENDGEEEAIEGFGTDRDATKLSKEEIRKIVKDAGIVGLGGAGFPTHVKLTPKDENAIDYVIVNGAECEPYLTSDYRTMMERPEQIIGGLKVMLQLFDNAKGVIGIENNKPEAIKKLTEMVKDEPRIEVCPLLTKYPQGGERTLIYAVTGREINSSMLPADAGCIVDNIDTVASIYNAVCKTTPLIRKIITVTGDAIADYLLHGRPTSKSTFVFLRSVAPYTNLKVGSCIGSRIVQKYAALSGVVWTTEERKGFHSFRRSLGRELLENDVPVCTISEILGHAYRNSTKQYLSVDVKHLRECALPLNELRCTKEALL